jgi:hypothetical protein
MKIKLVIHDSVAKAKASQELRKILIVIRDELVETVEDLLKNLYQ